MQEFKLEGKEAKEVLDLNNLKGILNRERSEQELENYKEHEINWVDNSFWDWDKLKGHTKKLLGSHEIYDEDDEIKLFFLSHSNDIIKGKPQLIDQVLKRLPLIKLCIKKDSEGTGKDKEEFERKKIFTIGERVDVRYDGYLKDSYAEDFWLYRIISEDGKEYYILSKEKLPNCTCNFKGMLIELDDFAEFSRSMKIKSLSRIFILKEFEPDIKILTKKQLIEYTQSRKLTETKWFDFLTYNPIGNFNRLPKDIELLNSSILLSGKLHGYPLHRFIFGVPGTKKTMGYIETLAYKFSEEPEICEGGSSRMKGLVPSFKEKPANLGYIAKQERFGFIDEIGKMIEKMSESSHQGISNSLGDINFLLEHKSRQSLSGNDGLDVQATSKLLLISNAISHYKTISQHLDILDPSTLSRMLIHVQDDDERDFLLNEDCIEKIPQTPTQEYTPTESNLNVVEIENRLKPLTMSLRKYIVEYIAITRDEFITLFDSCYNFLCEIDDDEIKRIVAGTTQLAKEPMKTSVWKPRAFHHVKLVVDGICKHRCLFKDYDHTFTAKQEDYDNAERILIRLVKGWDTILTPKQEFTG